MIGAGSHPTDPQAFFDGAVDEVRIYHRGLAPIEVRQLAGQPPRGYAGRLIAHLGLDETAGTVAADSGAFGNAGELRGGLDFAIAGIPGWINGGLRLDGRDDHVDLGPLDFTGLEALTVAAWVRPTDPSRNQHVIAKTAPGDTGAFRLGYDARSGTWQWSVHDADTDAWRTAEAAADLFDGDWHWLTGVVDPVTGEIRLYLDGTLAGTAPFTAGALGDVAQAPLVVGAEGGKRGGRNSLAGDVDEVRLYARVLTQAERQAVYAATTPDVDLDSDGIPDGQDVFPTDAAEWQDTDRDGVGDNADARPEDPTATSAIGWTFEVAASGPYEVWVTVPGGSNRTAAATYEITHADGVETLVLDQRTETGEVLLGTWDFEAGASQSVTLTNAADGYVAVDQLQVLPAGRSGPVTDAELSLVFVHADHLGTPQMLTDGSGGIAWAGAYAPFGAVVAEEGVVDNALRFPGQLRDVETGLHYNYFRDYEPTTGRYVQNDPIGLLGGYGSFNYSNENPVVFIDRRGLAAIGPVSFIREWEIALTKDLGQPPVEAIEDGVEALDRETCELQCFGPDYEDLFQLAGAAGVDRLTEPSARLAGRHLMKSIGVAGFFAAGLPCVVECIEQREGDECR